MSRRRRPHPLALLGAPLVLLLATLLRLFDLGRRSVWTDEGSTWTAAMLPVREMLARCIERDASPPLYYLLTSLALRAGDSEAWLRSVSLVASVAVVWITYRLARLGASRGEATLAALLVALSPMQIQYAQEARTYALATALSAAALYFFARAVLLGRGGRTWAWLVVTSTLALYTQSLAVIGVAVQGVMVLLTRTGRAEGRRWVGAQLLAFALFAPWAVVSAGQAARLADSHWYIPTPDGRGVFHVLRTVLLSPVALVSPAHPGPLPGLDLWLPAFLAHGLLALVVGTPLLAALASVVEPGGRGRTARLALAGVLVPIAAVLALSLVRPLWLPRYFLLLGPFVALLQARGVAELKPRPLARLLGVLLVATALYGFARYALDYTKEPWRDAVRVIAGRAAADAIALVTYDVDPWSYYERRSPGTPHGVEVSHPAVPFASHYTPQQLDHLEAAASRQAHGHSEVWVVVRSPNSEIRREVARRAERAAATEGRVLTERLRWDSSGGPVRAARFTRPAPPDSTAGRPLF